MAGLVCGLIEAWAKSVPSLFAAHIISSSTHTIELFGRSQCVCPGIDCLWSRTIKLQTNDTWKNVFGK